MVDVYYISQPKCGSTTIKYMLSAHPEINECWTPRLKVDGSFTFTVLRNPWARVASMYEHMCVTRPATVKPLSLKQVLTIGYDETIKAIDRHNIITNLSTKFMKESIRVHMYVRHWKDADVVLKLEELEQGWPMICEKLNITKTKTKWLQRRLADLHHKDKYKKYYDDETIQMVYENNKDVIEQFNYCFDEI